MDQRATTQAIPRAFSIAWSGPFALILIGHYLVDMYSNIVPSSLGVVRKEWQLTDIQAAWLLGVGSLTSGLAQPVFAWISDRTNSRRYGGIGLAMAALLISGIGLAHSQAMLFAFYMFGMIGVGMFHPIGASTIGQISQRYRSRSVSAFFVAGMAGGITGAFIGPRLLTAPGGFYWLGWLLIPGVLAAIVLHTKISPVEHRQHVSDGEPAIAFGPGNWFAVALLYAAAALRFMVNMALVYLYVRWMESVVATANPEISRQQVTDIAAPMIGNMNAATIAGMAMGGLVSGFLIPPGKEKWPMVVVPMVFAPVIGLFPFSTTAWAYLLSFGAGIAFAAMVPVSLAVAQRLLPHRSSLASSLMLGGAWAVAMVGPTLAEWGIQLYGIDATFFATAALLAVSGLVIFPVRTRTIRRSVYHG